MKKLVRFGLILFFGMIFTSCSDLFLSKIVDAKEPKIITQPVDFETDEIDGITLKINAKSLDDGELSYEWFKCLKQDVSDAVSVSKLSEYKEEKVASGTYYYYCKITNKNESRNISGKTETSILSNVIKVTVVEGEYEYKVEHYQQNIENNEYSLVQADTQILKGLKNTFTNAAAKNYEGFSSQPFSQQKIEPDNSTIIKIYYSRNRYTINFDSNGGSSILPITLKYGEKIIAPANPEKSGYTLSQWNPEIPATMPAHDFTLKAQWIEGEATPYKVEHYLQNADDDFYTLDFTDDKAGRTNSQTKAAAKTYPNFTVQPFSQQSISPDGDTVVSIYYNRNTFTLSFDTDGGSSIAPAEYKYGQTVIPPADPTKNLYLFKEWTPELPSTMPDEDVEIKAVWEQLEYTITYLDQNGSNFTGTFPVTAPSIHKYGTQTILPSPTKTGYTFEGWYTTSACTGSAITILAATEYTNKITVYAKWTDGVTLSVTALESYLSNITDKTKVYSFKISDTTPDLSDLKSILNSYNDIKISYDLSGCSGLTTVGDGAFYNRKNLAGIIIPSSVTSIGTEAFDGCSGLTSVTIPSSVTSIGNHAFENCIGLTSVTIPSSVTSIGNYAFFDCSGLTSVTIPSSITSIGEDAFCGCSNLVQITVDKNNPKYDSRDDCNGIIETSTNTLMTGCKNTIIPSSVTSIGSYPFRGCSGLTSVIIPSSVTSIGKYAFYNCSDLVQITVDKNNTKYDSRDNCNGIIETSTNTLVHGCKNTIIPSGVTSIGESAFQFCSGITSVTIPSSVTSIGDHAFHSCSGLTSVTIPSSVTSIGEDAFYGCSGLTSVTIPSSVTSIGNSAFGSCSGLTSVTIPSSVTSIGKHAFYNCIGLTSVTIPSSVISIGSYAFYDCKKLQTITFEDTTTWYRTTSSSNWSNKTGGAQTDVSSTTTNATNFKSNYYDYYWYKL